VSLTWLASHTSRIEFGPMVSPVSFRQPTMTVRMASAVDDLSGGRLHLGVGAGWQEREHTNYGWDLLTIPERMARLEEGLEVITRLLRSDTAVDFNGKYYHLKEAILLPRPQRPNGPPILIGGNGSQRTLPLVAKYAQEWNAVYASPAKIKELNELLDNLLVDNGRKPGDVRRSLMTGCVWGQDEAEVRRRLVARGWTQPLESYLERGMVMGSVNQMVDQIGRLAEAGIYRILLQWLELDDLDGLAELAKLIDQFK